MSLKRVGILGSGQLARMLAEAAQRLNLQPKILAANPRDSATTVGAEVIVGSLDNEAALKEFFSKTDITTYESDFLPYESLARYRNAGTIFLPPLESLEKIRNKIN